MTKYQIYGIDCMLVKSILSSYKIKNALIFLNYYVFETSYLFTEISFFLLLRLFLNFSSLKTHLLIYEPNEIADIKIKIFTCVCILCFITFNLSILFF